MNVHITQETFDAAVAENIELLEMSPDEAVSEAITQFEAQGVNLDTVVKEFHGANDSAAGGSGTTEHAAISSVRQLQSALKQQPFDIAAVVAACDGVRTVCDKSLADRCLAAKNDGFDALITALDAVADTDFTSLTTVLSALKSFVDGQPDVVTEGASQRLIDILGREPRVVDSVLAGILNVIGRACVMHEANRQTFVGLGLILVTTRLLRDGVTDRDVVRAACTVLANLTLDDDIRVPFGKGHEHAKLTVIEGSSLSALFSLAKVFVDDSEVLSDLFGVVARLCVRDEFCQQVIELDGIPTIFSTLQRHTSDQSLVKSLLTFVKVLAGSDRAKIDITRADGIESILDAVRTHHRSVAVCEAGCAAIGAIVLRFPAHSDAVINAGGPEIICTAMELHANSVAVQTQACVCIRNVVARRSDLAESFLHLGVERLLRRTLDKHKACRDEARSALRDLDCHIDLKELWTGSGRELARD